MEIGTINTNEIIRGFVIFFQIILQRVSIITVLPLFSFGQISCGYMGRMSGQSQDSGKGVKGIPHLANPVKWAFCMYHHFNNILFVKPNNYKHRPLGNFLYVRMFYQI